MMKCYFAGYPMTLCYLIGLLRIKIAESGQSRMHSLVTRPRERVGSGHKTMSWWKDELGRA